MENLRKRVKQTCLKTCYIIRGKAEDLKKLDMYLTQKGIDHSLDRDITLIYIPFKTTQTD